MNDRQIEEMLKSFKSSGQVDEALLNRIVVSAAARPQQHPRALSFGVIASRVFYEWEYAFSFKAAGLACLALLGFIIGLQSAPQESAGLIDLVSGTIKMEDIL